MRVPPVGNRRTTLGAVCPLLLIALGSLGCKDDQPQPTPPAPAADEAHVTPLPPPAPTADKAQAPASATDDAPATAPTPVAGGALEAYLKAFPFDRFEVVEIPDAGKFYVDDNPGLVKQALREGKAWSPQIIEAFREHVEPGTTAIDVGAHIGSLTVPLADLVGPEGKVYAFEPQRLVYRELYHNLKLNGFAHATPLLLAASSEAGSLEMDPPFVDDGWARIGKGGERVEARTIDSFGFTNVSLIKIDVEGHELEVLKGATETILSSHPVLIIEMGKVTRAVIEPMLVGKGYRLEKLTKNWVDYIAVYDPP